MQQDIRFRTASDDVGVVCAERLPSPQFPLIGVLTLIYELGIFDKPSLPCSSVGRAGGC